MSIVSQSSDHAYQNRLPFAPNGAEGFDVGALERGRQPIVHFCIPVGYDWQAIRHHPAGHAHNRGGATDPSVQAQEERHKNAQSRREVHYDRTRP